MLFNIFLVLAVIYFICLGLYFVCVLIEDAYKKHINKTIMKIEKEQEYCNLYCEVQCLKEEVKSLKNKKRGK